MTRLLLVFLTLAGLATAILRWIDEGRISMEMGAGLAILVTALIALDGISFRVILALVGLIGFGLHYAADGSWKAFAAILMAVMPLIICLLGFYIMFRGVLPGRRNGSQKTDRS